MARSNNYGRGYNIYGRLVTKKKKGCSTYYALLNVNAKKDGWVRCGIKLEVDFTEENIDWGYDDDEVLKIVMQVLRTPYLNRLKQFFIRLLRNNLFLGKKSKKIANSDPNWCFICKKHPEKRVPLFYFCKKVQSLVQYLIKILKRAGRLGAGHSIEIFYLKIITSIQ